MSFIRNCRARYRQARHLGHTYLEGRESMSERTHQTESLPDSAIIEQKDVKSGSAPFADDLPLIKALRGGDEAAFVSLLDQYHSTMLRLAMIYVPNRAVAEEVVQEAWVGVLQGLNRFEARSSLKTWLFRILINCAKTRGQRESRSVPFSSLSDSDSEPAEPAVDPKWFFPPDHPQSPGHWISLPQSWGDDPEVRLLSQETRIYIHKAIEALP